ncbi:hypothetical protein [Runella salmonicolor]|uniref:Uncharacterized protein n=1 Tax=Runella salmonicolor TaxID=2950278 RepID=A0ABT1FVL1_9BACT|nr:hypothetical protein [Runella salmonicolor]MCP1384808.1 hypothetical protein [Runella salmonicolor]
MRKYLDNVPIDEPQGMAGLYLEKPRSNRFGGQLRVNIGRVKNVGKARGIGEIQIIEPVAIAILSSAYEKYSVDASVKFQLEDNDGSKLIDSEINMSNFRDKPDGWSVTLRDSGDVETLDLQADTVVSITPTTEFELKPINLAQAVTHTINPDLARVARKTITSQNPTHFPAWKAASSKADATGTPQSVNDILKEQPVWVNSTGDEKRVYVTARLSIEHRSSSALSGQIMLYVISGVGTTSYPIVDVVLGSTLTSVTYAIEKEITVPQNGQVFIKINYSGSSFDYEFNYQDDSYLCINPDNTVPSSTVKGFYAIDALRAIAAKIAPNLVIKNDFVPLESMWITNGYNLRGVKQDLKVSFGAIWDDLNKLFNLMINRVSENEIIIVSRDAYIDNLDDGVLMQDVNYYEFGPSSLLVSRVRVGFKKWQSYTPTGNEEIYGNEDYSTGLTKIDNILDLECTTLCASEKLMEAVRRKQFEVGGDRSDKDEENDEQIFVKSTYAFPIDTHQQLKNWGGRWSASNVILTKTSGRPNNLAQSIQYTSKQFTGRAVKLQGNLTSRQWVILSDTITFYARNRKVKVFINNASYRPGAAGSGSDFNTIIEGLELKI